MSYNLTLGDAKAGDWEGRKGLSSSDARDGRDLVGPVGAWSDLVRPFWSMEAIIFFHKCIHCCRQDPEDGCTTSTDSTAPSSPASSYNPGQASFSFGVGQAFAGCPQLNKPQNPSHLMEEQSTSKALRNNCPTAVLQCFVKNIHLLWCYV